MKNISLSMSINDNISSKYETQEKTLLYLYHDYVY